MLLTLIAMISLGAGIAGVLLAAQRVLKLPVPRAAIPFASGLGMILFAMWTDYSWYDRVVSDLPPDIAIVSKIDEPSMLQPWSYFLPRTVRFAALDRRAVGDLGDGIASATLILVQRYQPTATVPVAFDCGQPRRTLRRIEGFDPKAADWRPVEPDDPARAAACAAIGAATDMG